MRSHIYAIGFRNPQGLVFGPKGLLYASDHGPNTDDELDLVRAGGNYGWPHVAGFRDDRAYEYANWSASTPTPCSGLKFDPLVPPPSVPRVRESAWNDAAFVPPLATFFTVAADYDVRTFGTRDDCACGDRSVRVAGYSRLGELGARHRHAGWRGVSGQAQRER